MTVARYYHPEYGFTVLIEFAEWNHDNEIDAVRQAPHFDHPNSGGYDGQFYAQLAVDPLLRDPALDQALDNPPYRARRILTPWIAYAAGLGRPAWVLQAYAVQGIVAWLVLAVILALWIPPTDASRFVLWSTAVLAHGPLMSVRYALPDITAAVIVAAGVLAAERGRPIVAALLLGVAGLARETSLCAAAMFGRLLKRPWRTWLLTVICLIVCLLPLALWLDYLRSIFRALTFAGGEHIVWPLAGLWWKLGELGRQLANGTPMMAVVGSIAALVAFTTQASWLVWRLTARRDVSPWVLVGLGFLALALVADPPVWEGTPGAYPRVFLPMMLAARVTMARESRPAWWLAALAGLDVIPGIQLMFLFAWR